MTVPEPDRERRAAERERSFVVALVVATSMPGAVVAGVAIGWWIDQFQGTSPLWTGVLGGASLAAALHQLIRGTRG
jgi:F0F1-type ATP synthase assembly protein I